MRGSISRRVAMGLMVLPLPAAVFAQRARSVIMRHAGKHNPYALCDLGAQRGLALVSQFPGRSAAQALFAAGEKPDTPRFAKVNRHRG